MILSMLQTGDVEIEDIDNEELSVILSLIAIKNTINYRKKYRTFV